MEENKKYVPPAPIKFLNFSCSRKEQLLKETEQESLNRRNFSTKNPFLGT